LKLVDLCLKEWSVETIHTGVEKVAYTIAVAAKAMVLAAGEKLPFATITSKDSFETDVEACKKNMNENIPMNAEDFYILVHPAWNNVVSRLKKDESKHVHEEKFPEALTVAKSIQELMKDSPESLKGKLMSDEKDQDVLKDCDELISKILSHSQKDQQTELERAYKRIRMT